ncbi:3'-5' exonuclease [Patescibacteria group bacterium]|nr:3'-5' exonuclease [Patescibacteria group bacterium]
MFIISDPLKKIIKLLKLDKPLVIFDVETTGSAISEDKIVELAFIKIWPDGRIKKEEMILNPEIPISPEASTIHGLADQDVDDKPTFRQVAQELWEIFNDCYYAGFNVMNFDLMILRREFIRIGMHFDYETSRIIDSKVLFQYLAPSTLSAAYEFYCRKDYKQEHTALGDVEVAAEILIRQLERYKEVRDWEFVNKIHQAPDNPSELFIDNTRKFYWRRGEAYFAFSKHRDKSLAQVAEDDPKFLKWILSADFSDETKNIVREALKNRFAKKKLNS